MAAVREVQWSELQRDPKSVAALADAGDVRVRRRDGAPLVLSREDRIEAAGHDVFRRRPRYGLPAKLGLAWRAWRWR